MKKLLFAIFLIATSCVIAQTKIVKKTVTVSKPYHMFKNPNEGYETALQLHQIEDHLYKWWSGTDFSNAHPDLPGEKNQKFWVEHFNKVFGTRYTNSKELLQYLAPGRIKFVSWPATGLRVTHFGVENGTIVFGYKDRIQRADEEMAVEVDGKIIASSMCLNPAFDVSKVSLQNVKKPVVVKNDSLQYVEPPAGTQNAAGILVRKKTNFASDWRIALGTPIDQKPYYVENEKKGFFRTTVGKIAIGAVGGTIIYFVVKMLLPQGGAVGGGPSQGGGAGATGGPSQGG